MGRFFICIYLIFLPYLSIAQLYSLPATKIDKPIKIDGDLNDASWTNIHPVFDFTTVLPVFGKKAEKSSIVKIAYDNTAIYIGAYLYDDPSQIRRSLTERDVIELQDADYFTVGLDTYNNNQQAFVFQVTAASVQGDARMSLMGNATSSDV